MQNTESQVPQPRHLGVPGGDPRAGGPDKARECLTFLLGEEKYAIDILRVQEIRGYERVTLIADAPAFIKGVINLRGDIVPVVDLRMKFGVASCEYTPLTVVIILNVARRVIGIVVDAVSEVVRFAAGEIKDAPEFGGGIDTRHVVGLATLGDCMVTVIDIERLIARADMALIDELPA